MRKVAFISAVSAVIGYAVVHFAFFAKPKPTPAPETPTAQAPAEAVVLADVVEVVNTETLLDAPPKEPEGVPFDPQVVPASFTEPVSVPPIPQAEEDPVADPGRVMWYGGHRLPKQIGGGVHPDELARGVREMLSRPRDVYTPSGVSCGMGFYF